MTDLPGLTKIEWTAMTLLAAERSGELDLTPLRELLAADARGDVEACLGLLPRVVVLIGTDQEGSLGPLFQPGVVLMTFQVALEIVQQWREYDAALPVVKVTQ